MAKSRARVRLAGRFSPGARVELVEVASEAVLRTSPTDKIVEAKFVDEDGQVEFATNVTDGGRYFVRGQQNGFPLEVRVRGRVPDEDTDSVNSVAPVQTEPRKFSGGEPVDQAPADAVAEVEAAERVRKAGPAGSDAAREEEAAIRAERAEAAEKDREEAEKDLSDEEKVGARNARSQSKRAPRASNDNVKGA
jgi:hypothetical protein